MSGTPTIQIDNPQFLKNPPASYDCVMVLGKTYLSYALLDEAHTTVFAIRHYDFGKQTVGKSDFDTLLSERLVQKATRYFLAVDTIKQTTIPTELYQADKKHLYVQHLFEVDYGEALHEMTVGAAYTNVFVLKKDSVQYFNHRIRNLQFFSSAAVTLSSYPAHSDDAADQTVFVGYTGDGFTISAFKQKELLFQRSFAGFQSDDILYHLANLTARYQFDPNKTTVRFHGESEQSTQVVALLEQQYHRVDYCTRIHEFAFPEDLFALPSHYFFTLFSLAQCAS